MAVTAVSARAEPTKIWKLDLDRDVRWFKTSPAGVFLVATDREILGVAPDSGNVLWRIGPIKDSDSPDVELIAGQPMALLQIGARDSLGLPPLSLIDLRDGHTLPIRHEGLLRSSGSFVIPGTNDLIVFATTSRDGVKKTAIRVDLATGVPRWTSPKLYDEFEPVLLFEWGFGVVRARQVPYFDTDSSMILHMLDGTFRRFDLNTGALVWSGRGKGAEKYASASTWVNHSVTRTEYNTKSNQVETKVVADELREFDLRFAPLLASSNGARFYAPYSRSVAAFSSASGQSLWPDPPHLKGSVAQMQETPLGLLVRTVEASDKKFNYHRILLLDAETGVVRWRWPKTGGLSSLTQNSYWTDATNFVLENDRVVIAADGRIRTADLAKGKEQILAKLEFDHYDDPRTLLSGPGGYTAIGGCNLGIYAKADGQRTHHYYRRPPFDVGWGFALLALSAVTRGFIEPQLGFELLDAVPDLSRSNQVESYVYFLALMNQGNGDASGVVRVRLETAEPAGELFLRTKKPAYRIDADGRIYIWSAMKAISCYRF